MSMNDPLGDMLTRIRNGQSANKEKVVCLGSKLAQPVCQVLKDEGFIRNFKIKDLGNNKKAVEVELKYFEGKPVIREIRRVSKPGRRVYSKVRDFPSFYDGLGICVVSTPHGVMADHKARKENVGGEILCQVF